MNIERIKNEDRQQILQLCVNVFKHLDDEKSIISYLNKTVNWNISVKAIENEKIIGCYLLNEESVLLFKQFQLENLDYYKSKKGLQGIALLIDEKFRGKGFGRQLRNVVSKMPYDYMWGQHLKSLENVDKWKKLGRRIVAETKDLYITLIDLNKRTNMTKTQKIIENNVRKIVRRKLEETFIRGFGFTKDDAIRWNLMRPNEASINTPLDAPIKAKGNKDLPSTEPPVQKGLDKEPKDLDIEKPEKPKEEKAKSKDWEELMNEIVLYVNQASAMVGDAEGTNKIKILDKLYDEVTSRLSGSESGLDEKKKAKKK